MLFVARVSESAPEDFDSCLERTSIHAGFISKNGEDNLCGCVKLQVYLAGLLRDISIW